MCHFKIRLKTGPAVQGITGRRPLKILWHLLFFQNWRDSLKFHQLLNLRRGILWGFGRFWKVSFCREHYSHAETISVDLQISSGPMWPSSKKWKKIWLKDHFNAKQRTNFWFFNQRSTLYSNAVINTSATKWQTSYTRLKARNQARLQPFSGLFREQGFTCMQKPSIQSLKNPTDQSNQLWKRKKNFDRELNKGGKCATGSKIEPILKSHFWFQTVFLRRCKSLPLNYNNSLF